jgi:hypothetical protein
VVTDLLHLTVRDLLAQRLDHVPTAHRRPASSGQRLHRPAHLLGEDRSPMAPRRNSRHRSWIRTRRRHPGTRNGRVSRRELTDHLPGGVQPDQLHLSQPNQLRDPLRLHAQPLQLTPACHRPLIQQPLNFIATHLTHLSTPGRLANQPDTATKRTPYWTRRRSLTKKHTLLEERRALIKDDLGGKDEGALFQIANGFDLRHRRAGQRGEYDEAFLDWIFWWYLATVELTNRLIASRSPA